jgi:raffinose/stachyose/melibiose transport system permease protein
VSQQTLAYRSSQPGAAQSGTATSTSRRQPRWIAAIFRHAFLVVFAGFAVLPAVFTVLASFKSLFDFYNRPLGLPEVWLWQNYVSVWKEAGIPQAALNSVIIVGISVPLILFFAATTAYGLARFQFRGNAVIYYLFLAGLIIPIQLTILPLVQIDKKLGLINTYAGLILPYAGNHLAFPVFMLTGFLRTIPTELRDAALIDGASEYQVFWKIIAPLMRPALATIAILNLVSIWNDFFFPLIVSPKIPTLQVAVYNLLGVYSTQWGQVFAGVVTGAIPLLVAYLMLTRQFIAGLSAGAVKG